MELDYKNAKDDIPMWWIIHHRNISLVLLTESYQSSRVYTALHIDSDESGHVDIVGNKARVDGNS